jgi:hypothetical protein
MGDDLAVVKGGFGQIEIDIEGLDIFSTLTALTN